MRISLSNKPAAFLFILKRSQSHWKHHFCFVGLANGFHAQDHSPTGYAVGNIVWNLAEGGLPQAMISSFPRIIRF